MNEFMCRICGGEKYVRLPGRARDNSEVVPLKCLACGQVMLSSLDGSTKEAFVSGGWKVVADIPPQLLSEQSRADSARRYAEFQHLIHGRRVLDFGSGNGAFLALAKGMASSVTGVDLDRSRAAFYEAQDIPLYDTLDTLPVGTRFDLITLFHVLGHIVDPLPVLEKLRELLDENGTLLIETPNADDALLSMYDCEAFANFTYYASYVFFYSSSSLRMLLEKAGFSVKSLYGIQRYPLSNHLYWLAKGGPGGQNQFPRLNDPVLNLAYERKLADEGITDTLVAICGVA